MFLLSEPEERKIKALLNSQAGKAFSYVEVGASQFSAPAGYNVDHNRVLLGPGREAFSKAISAVNDWKMFDLGWVRLNPQHPPVKAGEVVAVLVRHLGFWSVNISRIVYTIEEHGGVERYGFAYGTLLEHAEQGEERFTVEHQGATDEVWYDLYAFSKPRHLLARLGYPFSRHLQKRFCERVTESYEGCGERMKTLVLNHDQVAQLLPMPECIEVMQDALSALARGEAEQPLRTIFKPENVRGVLAMMPSFRRGDTSLFGLKAICVFPDNSAIGKDAHQGGVLLFSGETGELLALVNASAITAIRTAAVSAAATRALARENASELTILGAGVQAHSHLEAIACVRSIKRARIVARRFEKARVFANEMQSKFEFPIEAKHSAEEAVTGADLVVTATIAREPVVKRQWIQAGAHINAIGTFSPKARELDTATMRDATLFVDRRESALNEAGDYILAAAEGAIGPEHIRAELGEVLIGSHPGRTSDDEITVFKSLGLAIEDLAAAEYVYRKASQQSGGTWVAF